MDERRGKRREYTIEEMAATGPHRDRLLPGVCVERERGIYTVPSAIVNSARVNSEDCMTGVVKKYGRGKWVIGAEISD